MKTQFFLSILAFSIFRLDYAQEARFTLDDYISDKFRESGIEIACAVVPGKPPSGYRAPIAIISPTAVLLENVPAFSWSFGCSSTAAAMAAGYYDNMGYPGMYTGPANDGIIPMDNNCWGMVTINGETRNQCPLSATMQNLDGRQSRGHVDDYWIVYHDYGPDPYLINGWSQHEYSDCTGDFMGTNQSSLGNADGNTRFFFFPDGSPLYDYTGNEPNRRDGCHGLRLFYESRGYPVIENYTQLIYGMYGNTTGFTFEQYREEIDNGRPVILQLSGHSMLGLGYDVPGSLVYLHDTWDNETHSMTWGGSYFGMAQWGVTVVRLESENPPPQAEFSGTPLTIAAGQSVSFTDYSSNNPTTWEWIFEGGSPAYWTESNPVVVYDNPGSYKVSLKAYNDNGYDSKIKYAYIMVTVPKILSLKLYLEGLFNPDSGVMNQVQGQSGAFYPIPIADMITVKLADPGFPGNSILYSGEVPLLQDGSCILSIPASLNGSYYIIIQHRNSIESWSASPVPFASSSITYDFTTEASRVFGSNQKQIQGIYCLFSGDINQDGIVDSGDIIRIENLEPSFAAGYLSEDLNGDGIVDSGDFILLDNNTRSFITTMTPD